MSKYYEMMSIYENGNNHVFLTIDEKSEPKGEYCSERGVYLIDEKLYHFNCDSEKGNVFTDYLYNDLNWLIFSEKTLKIFDELEVEYQAIEISITPDAPCKYYIINLLSSVEGLDESESKYIVVVEDEKGTEKYRRLPKKFPTLLENRIKGLNMFRLKESQLSVYASETVKKRFEEEKITGLDFSPVQSRYALKDEGIVSDYLECRWGEASNWFKTKYPLMRNYNHCYDGDKILELSRYSNELLKLWVDSTIDLSLWRLWKREGRKFGKYYELALFWGQKYAVCQWVSGKEADIENIKVRADIYKKIIPRTVDDFNQFEEIAIPRVLLPHILRDIKLGVSRIYHESGVYYLDMQREKLYCISNDVIGPCFQVVEDLYVVSKAIQSGLSDGSRRVYVYPYSLKGHKIKSYSPQGKESEFTSLFENVQDIEKTLYDLEKMLEGCEEALNPKELEYRPIEESMRGKKMGEMEQNPLEPFLSKWRIESLEHIETKEFFEFYDYFEHGGGGTLYKLAKHEIISLYILNKENILIRRRYYDSYGDSEHNPQTLEELRKQPPHENQQIIVPIEMLEPWLYAEKHKLNREFIMSSGIFYYIHSSHCLISESRVNQHDFSIEQVSASNYLMNMLVENKKKILNRQEHKKTLFYRDTPYEFKRERIEDKDFMASALGEKDDYIRYTFMDNDSILNILNFKYGKLDIKALENKILTEKQIPEIIYAIKTFSKKELDTLIINIERTQYMRASDKTEIPFWEHVFYNDKFEIFRAYCAKRFNGLTNEINKYIKKEDTAYWLSRNSGYGFKILNQAKVFCQKARAQGRIEELKPLLNLMTKEELNSYYEEEDYKGTPLMIAIKHCDEEVVEELLEIMVDKGVDINVETPIGSALHSALVNTYHKLLVLIKLLKLNPNMNTRDSMGMTPLLKLSSSFSYHSKQGTESEREYDTEAYRYKLVEKFIELGADIHATSNNGESIHRYLNTKFQEFKIKYIELFTQHGYSIETVTPGYELLGRDMMMIAMEKGEINVIKRLLMLGYDVNKRRGTFKSPLISYCISFNHSIEVLKYFLENGANPNLGDSMRQTALTQAVNRNKLDIVSLLLRYGADPNIQEKESGKSIFINAILRESLEISQLLYEHGGNIHDVYNGKTALEWMFEASDSDMIAWAKELKAKLEL